MRHQRTAISLAGSLLTFVAIGGFLTSANPSIATAQVLESQPEVGRTGSQPSSDRASNTGADVNAPQIAPSLPLPSVDENASPEELLHAARAQTRLLDRSVPLFKTNQPSTHPAIPLISEALHALGAGDRAGAMAYLDKAIPLAIPPKE